MKDIFDLFAEGVVTEEEEISRDVLESVIIEEAVDKISMLSEGVLKKLTVKTILNPDRKARMLDGKPFLKGRNNTYDIRNVYNDMECVDYYIKHDNGLSEEEKKELREYLPKIKKRFNDLGGKKAWAAAKNKASRDTLMTLATLKTAHDVANKLV